jgi:hypothetical protein
MFEGPEYESYIKLCRELRLERMFEKGDALARPFNVLAEDKVSGTGLRPVDIEWGIRVYGPDEQHEVGDQAAPPALIWLPRLDQWLAMLEEAGAGDWMTFLKHGSWPEPGYQPTITYELRCQNRQDWSIAPTREEAAARLWVAVTGRLVSV